MDNFDIILIRVDMVQKSFSDILESINIYHIVTNP